MPRGYRWARKWVQRPVVGQEGVPRLKLAQLYPSGAAQRVTLHRGQFHPQPAPSRAFLELRQVAHLVSKSDFVSEDEAPPRRWGEEAPPELREPALPPAGPPASKAKLVQDYLAQQSAREVGAFTPVGGGVGDEPPTAGAGGVRARGGGKRLVAEGVREVEEAGLPTPGWQTAWRVGRGRVRGTELRQATLNH